MYRDVNRISISRAEGALIGMCIALVEVFVMLVILVVR